MNEEAMERERERLVLLMKEERRRMQRSICGMFAQTDCEVTEVEKHQNVQYASTNTQAQRHNHTRINISPQDPPHTQILDNCSRKV